MTGRVRKRVSQACKPCGFKKIKCDGVYPECGPCHNKERCSYGATKRKIIRTSLAGSPGTQSISVSSPASQDNASRSSVVAREPPKKLERHWKIQGETYALSVPAQVSARLFQTYFNCIHPIWPLLYKPMYSSLDYTRPTSMLPPVLISAIFSIAACVQERPPTVESITSSEAGPNNNCPEPKLFFEEALMLLQENDEGGTPHPLNSLKPSITNCQVLVILALQQHGVAEYSRAAMLCALASAMAIELRLHRSYESTDPIQTEVRSRLWWNVFIAEKMTSSEMGRPIILRSEETDAPYPSISEADEFELMPARQNTPTNSRNGPVKLRTMSVFHTTIKLSMITEKISRDVYSLSARKAIRENQSVGEQTRMKLWLMIRDWERDVETSPLRLDLNDGLSTVPSSVTNHVVLWSHTILLHRPFIERWQSNPASAYPESIVSPFEICFEAANKICAVLEKYADCLPGLPCDMVFSIFTAASTFLYHLQQNQSDVEIRRRLKLCIHWLLIIGNNWQSAGARHQLLAELFDLPQELRPSKLNPPIHSSPSSNFSEAFSNHLSPMTIPTSTNMNFQATSGLQTPMEEWAFLRGFGDSTDDFYALDMQLRELLDGGLQFGAEGNGFL